MNKIKKYIGILILFLLLGCGADVNYNMQINTEDRSVQLNIKMVVQEEDYQHIQGGKDALLEVINRSKPTNMAFALDANNANTFLFGVKFESYKQYQKEYKDIAGEDSKSIFEEGERSKKNPFITYQSIEINDDFSIFLNWLESELVNKGMVSQDNKESLVNSSKMEYQFNEEEVSSYKNDFYEEDVIEIKNTSINVVLKENDELDFQLAFLIDEESTKGFEKNLKGYLKEKEVKFNLQSKEEKGSSKSNIKYEIEVDDLSLLENKAQDSINGLFGDNFIQIVYDTQEEDSLWLNKKRQTTRLQLKPNSLFSLSSSNDAVVKIDVDGLTVEMSDEKKLELPYEKKIIENESFYLTINTKDESVKIIPIIFVLLILTGGGLLAHKYKTKNIVSSVKGKTLMALPYIREFIYTKFFISDLYIGSGCLEGKDFIINTKTIAKVDMAHTFRKKLFMVCGLFWILCLALFNLDNSVLGTLMLIAAIIMSILNYLVYSVLTINLELDSGMNYYFYFDNDDKTKEIYIELINKLDEEIDVEMASIRKREGK